MTANQVSLNLFLDALVWCGCDIDIHEVECIVANLIFRQGLSRYVTTVLSLKHHPTAPNSSHEKCLRCS